MPTDKTEQVTFSMKLLNYNRLLVFKDEVTEDRSSRKNSEVYKDINCQDSAKWRKVDWAALHSTNENDPKHTAKATQKFRLKKVEYSAMAKSISWFQPDWACISLAEDKTKDRKTQKQTTTEVSCSKGLAKHHKGVNSVSGDAHEFQT